MASKRRAKDDFYNKVVAPWVKASGTCFKCKVNRSEHCHHILTRGAYITLYLHPLDLLPLCDPCHRLAHGTHTAAKFLEWVEIENPGIIEKLWTLGREWLKKPLEEIKELYKSLPEWEENWRAA